MDDADVDEGKEPSKQSGTTQIDDRYMQIHNKCGIPELQDKTSTQT